MLEDTCHVCIIICLQSGLSSCISPIGEEVPLVISVDDFHCKAQLTWTTSWLTFFAFLALAWIFKESAKVARNLRGAPCPLEVGSMSSTTVSRRFFTSSPFRWMVWKPCKANSVCVHVCAHVCAHVHDGSDRGVPWSRMSAYATNTQQTTEHNQCRNSPTLVVIYLNNCWMEPFKTCLCLP